MVRVLTMPAPHSLPTRRREPAHMQWWLEQRIRRAEQRMPEEGKDDDES